MSNRHLSKVERKIIQSGGILVRKGNRHIYYELCGQPLTVSRSTNEKQHRLNEKNVERILRKQDKSREAS